MADEPGTGKKRIIAVVLAVLALAVLAAPFGLLANQYGKIFSTAENALAGMASLAALLAVSFLFLEVMIGSFSPLLVRAFNPPRLRRLHIVLGLIGLVLALAHFMLLIPKLGEHASTDNRVFFIAGPIVLVLLIFTIATALMSKKFSRSWRSIHVVNYFILVIAIVHGLVIGNDAGMLALRLLFYGYLTFIFIGFVYRASNRGWRRSLRLPHRTNPSGTNL